MFYAYYHNIIVNKTNLSLNLAYMDQLRFCLTNGNIDGVYITLDSLEWSHIIG